MDDLERAVIAAALRLERARRANYAACMGFKAMDTRTRLKMRRTLNEWHEAKDAMQLASAALLDSTAVKT